MNKNTLIVNLFGGPGTGKSTCAAFLFVQLKLRDIDCELVTEFAKDLTWEKRSQALDNQIYVFGKQHHRLFRLIGKVDIIITDSPLITSLIYDQEQRKSLRNLVFEEHCKCNNFNIFLKRKKRYNPNGRNQTEKEAVEIDKRIKNILKDNKIKFIQIEANPIGYASILDKILYKL